MLYIYEFTTIGTSLLLPTCLPLHHQQTDKTHKKIFLQSWQCICYFTINKSTEHSLIGTLPLITHPLLHHQQTDQTRKKIFVQSWQCICYFTIDKSTEHLRKPFFTVNNASTTSASTNGRNIQEALYLQHS